VNKVRVRAAIAVTLVVVLVVGFLAFALGFVGVGNATALSSIPAECPQTREEPGPQPFFSNARRHPVPFTATAAVLCLYKQVPSGVNADPSGYAEAFSKQLLIADPAKADALATEIDAGSRRGAVFTVHGCGGGTGERVAAYFQGGPSQAVEVVISAGGCPTASNGGNVSSIANSEIVPDVLALFGCRFPRPDAAPPNFFCGL
jgi:hypothetical protein